MSNENLLRAELERMEVKAAQMTKQLMDAWKDKDFAKSEVLSLRVALVNSATQICDMQETIDALRDQVQALHETLAL